MFSILQFGERVIRLNTSTGETWELEWASKWVEIPVDRSVSDTAHMCRSAYAEAQALKELLTTDTTKARDRAERIVRILEGREL